MSRRLAGLILVLAGTRAWAQLPAPETLPDADARLFRAEIGRLEQMLASAPDKAAVTYLVARTWAAGGQWAEAVEWLRKGAAMKAGIDPSRDAVFAALRGTREFEEILAGVREETRAISHSRVAFHLSEGDLVPESVAYDARGKRFYFGSMRKGKVIRCSGGGECSDFATGLGVVLGLKVHGDGLWVLNNAEGESALLHFELRSGRMIRAYRMTGAGHNFNDLTISRSGEIYLTDTAAGAVWHLAKGSEALERLAGEFPFANGIAISEDARLLYVSTFPDGIRVVDLNTGGVSTIGRPAELCLANIDGLYFYKRGLIAIQNGFVSPRVIRMRLNGGGHTIGGNEVLERRHPLFDGVTTGTIAGNTFYYMANIQDEKKADFSPITILRLGL